MLTAKVTLAASKLLRTKEDGPAAGVSNRHSILTSIGDAEKVILAPFEIHFFVDGSLGAIVRPFGDFVDDDEESAAEPAVPREALVRTTPPPSTTPAGSELATVGLFALISTEPVLTLWVIDSRWPQ